MEAIVKKHINRRMPDGSVVPLAPGDRITLEWSPNAEQLVNEGYLEIIIEGDERKHALEAFMDATMFALMKEIQEIGYWKTTPAVLEIEEEIHRIYVAVLAGIKRLADYREAFERWWKAVGKKH